jgi:hypothetical protein
MRWLALAPIALLGSCKFGGPSANPNAYVASDSGDDATPEDGPSSPGDDAPVASDDSGGGPGADDADDADGASTTPDGGAASKACDAAVAVCDPVHNTGCNGLQQCDVNPSVTAMPTGNCVFYSGSDGGGACTMTPISESCPPGSTCVSGACRSVCLCNTDCPTGQCCSEPSGAQGFTLCAPCI